MKIVPNNGTTKQTSQTNIDPKVVANPPTTKKHLLVSINAFWLFDDNLRASLLLGSLLAQYRIGNTNRCLLQTIIILRDNIFFLHSLNT